ncbi:unnamed protein product [Caenorhabditis auriculariae]|uniref:Uncharacterized protein n=1 Tax=Caenorhabditis auriculariae TaxID=2777116 RepID=A0A8S1HDQ1_9PELO|nr:unnamed protein product [Caenorhabditis auriculariae]
MALVASSDSTGLNPMSFNDQQSNLMMERLRYQRETGRFCDVAVIVKDRQFPAHRNILASCSPYFDSIFKAAKITKEQVTVNCSSPEAFDALLNYMYSGAVVIDRATVSELLRLANNFLVTRLKSYCSEYLDRYLDAANCLSVRLLASKYNLPNLLKSASDYFEVNINRCLLESIDILQYSPQQLLEIISDPKYCDVITPDTHLKLISRWAGEDVHRREMAFRQLLEGCQVADVNEDTLDFLLDYSPLFSKSQSSRFLLLSTMSDLGLLKEKYEAQCANLRQQIGQLPPIESSAFYDDELSSEGMEDEDFEEPPVEGHQTTSQVLESGTLENGERPKIKLRINLAAAAAGGVDLKKRFKPSKLLLTGHKRRGRPPTRTHENEMIPMLDDDDIDGVYATSSLVSALTYGIEDQLDPDDVAVGVDDADDNIEENGAFPCTYCKFSSNSEETVEKHRARQHNRNTYFVCQLCEYESNWSKAFYEHCREHWTSTPYQCDMCAYSTSSSIQDFLAHRLIHTEERFFKCGECAWKARTRTQLWAHERMHSVLDERPLHCDECGRGFHQHSALDHHVASHNDIRPIVCEDCGFATKVADHMTTHRRQHTGDMFFCHIEGCDYSSPKKSQLAAHLRTHMAVRAHMCKVCGRGFIEKSHLVRHERIHLEDKPFKCDACDYASSRRDKLKEHILKHHNGAATSKAHRRRYRRAKQLAALHAPQTKQLPNEAMFRPIPVNESVSQWADSNDFRESYSPRPNDFGVNTQNAFSPQRAFSVINAPSQPVPMSPGSMSLMNVNLFGPDTPVMPKHVGSINNTMQLVTPVPRSPHNRSADPYGIQSTADAHRPMSLPPYGQVPPATMEDQQRNDNNPNIHWWK